MPFIGITHIMSILIASLPTTRSHIAPQHWVSALMLPQGTGVIDRAPLQYKM